MRPSPDEHSDHEYLGDGVYASFDGYQIWLAANDHRNIVIALEPDVFEALVQYRDRLVRKYAEENTHEVQESSDV